MLWLIQEKSEKDSPQTHHISGNGADGDGKFCFRYRGIVLINNIIHFQSIPARFALEVFPAPLKSAFYVCRRPIAFKMWLVCGSF